MISQINFLALFIVFFLSLNCPVEANSHLKSLPADTQEDLALLKRIADNPDLLNQKYLECYLGPKASAMTAPSSQSLRSPAPVTRTFWLDRSEVSTRYTLEQSVPQLDKSLAEFSFTLTRQEDIILPDISKTLNKDPSSVIDENAVPAFLYSMSPTVKVFAYQDTQVVNLYKIAVQYAGPSLSLPSKADMDEATKHRRDKAIDHVQHGRHDQASSLLQSHLAANPNDAEAHLKLAESYQARSCINDAIREYKTALAVCGNDNEIHDRCIEGLHSLKVDLPNRNLQTTNSLTPHSNTLGARININPESSNNYQPSINSNAQLKIKTLDVGF